MIRFWKMWPKILKVPVAAIKNFDEQAMINIVAQYCYEL